MFHLVLHFIVPILVVFGFYRPIWKIAIVTLMMTMLVDLDHLLATPIYDPARCSINFHPLHTYWAIGLYGLLLLPKQTRLIGIGLVIHMLLDWQDCYFKFF